MRLGQAQGYCKPSDRLAYLAADEAVGPGSEAGRPRGVCEHPSASSVPAIEQQILPSHILCTSLGHTQEPYSYPQSKAMQSQQRDLFPHPSIPDLTLAMQSSVRLAFQDFIDAPIRATGEALPDVKPFFQPPYYEWWNATQAGHTPESSLFLATTEYRETLHDLKLVICTMRAVVGHEQEPHAL